MLQQPNFPVVALGLVVACQAPLPAPSLAPASTIAIVTPQPEEAPLKVRYTAQDVSSGMVTADGRMLFALSDAIVERTLQSHRARRVPFTVAAQPPHTATVVFPPNGDTFAVQRQNETQQRVWELWDTRTLTPRIDLKLDQSDIEEFSEEGTLFLIMTCNPDLAPPTLKGEQRDPYCTTTVRRSHDGAVVTSFAAPPYDPQKGARFVSHLSPDGRYVFFMGSQEVHVYSVQTGKRVLLRKGGRIYPSTALEEGGAEVFALIAPDRLLLSRFGVLEVDDLKSGQVVATQRYSTVVDDGYRHLLSPDRKVVATLSIKEKSVRLWDMRKTVRTATLPRDIECTSCTFGFQPNGGIRVYEATREGKTFLLDVSAEGILTAQTESTAHGPFYLFERGGFHVERNEEGITLRLPNGRPGPDIEDFADFRVSGGALLVQGQGMAGAIRSDGTATWLGALPQSSQRPVMTPSGFAVISSRDQLVPISKPLEPRPDVPKDATLLVASATHLFYQRTKPWRLFARDAHGVESLLSEESTPPGESEPVMGLGAVADGPHVMGAVYGNRHLGVRVCTVGETPCRSLPGAQSVRGLQWPIALLSHQNAKPVRKVGHPSSKPSSDQTLALHNLETGEVRPLVEDDDVSTFGIVRAPNLLVLSFMLGKEHALIARTPEGKVAWTLPLEGKGMPQVVPNYAVSTRELVVQDSYGPEGSVLRVNLATRMYSQIRSFEDVAIETFDTASLRPKVWGDPNALDGIAWCESPGTGNATILTLASHCFALPTHPAVGKRPDRR